MLSTIKNKIVEWQYVDGHYADGWQALWGAIVFWWNYRPRKVPCAHCGSPVWYNQETGEPIRPVYCSEACAYYGPATKELADGEVPF